jgi:protein SCO1/2
MIRTPLALIPYLVLAAFMAAGAAWNLSNSAPRGVYSTSIGGPFALTDQNGQPTTDASLHGKFALLYFGYTNCPDVCPTTLAIVANAMKDIGARAADLTVVFITVDPARDTPKVLKAYLGAFSPRFVGLTGSAAAIKKVATEYHVYYAKQPPKDGGYEVNHSSEMYLLNPRGALVNIYDPGTDEKTLVADLDKRL